MDEGSTEAAEKVKVWPCPMCGAAMLACTNCGHQGCVGCGWGQKELTLYELEKQHIVAVLVRTGGNQSEAARVLGVGRTTLWRKMTVYGIQRIGGTI